MEEWKLSVGDKFVKSGITHLVIEVHKDSAILQRGKIKELIDKQHLKRSSLYNRLEAGA